MQQYLKDIHGTVENFMDKEIELKGWIRNHRKQKEFGFIDFSDGTCFKHMQIVYDKNTTDFDKIDALKHGSAISVVGTLVKSEGAGQDYEIKANILFIESILFKQLRSA